MLKLKINASMSDILFYKHFETTANISNQKQYKLIYIQCNCSLSCPTLCDPTDCSPPRILFSWNFPGKNTGVSCHFFLQEIFLTQGSNPYFLYWQDSLPTPVPPGKPIFYT